MIKRLAIYTCTNANEISTQNADKSLINDFQRSLHWYSSPGMILYSVGTKKIKEIAKKLGINKWIRNK